MAKTKISQYDATAGNNTDIDSINIAEGMAPSNVNNAIRELMAHLKDMDAGTQALTSPQLSSVDINGGTIDGAVIGANSAAAITGTTITGTSLVIGSANINENDFESIDGITAGTVAASKAVIVDTNKDITGFRNVTLTGELDAATLDVSGDIDVDGTANLDVVDIDGAVDMASTLTLAGNADFNGDLDVDGTANLDVVDIDGAVDFASTTTHAGNATFADNAKAIFGAGSDLNVYHNASHSYVQDTGAGNLYLAGSNVIISNPTASETMAYFDDDGGVSLWYDNAVKLATASGGITVTGNIANASGDLTLDVAGNIKLDADDNGEVRYLDGGTQYLYIKKDGNTAVIQNVITDGDIEFRGDNGGSLVTALKLDMSEGGAATFGGNVGIGTSSPNAGLEVLKSGGGKIRISETAAKYVEIIGYAEGAANGSTMAFHTIEAGTSTSTERARITSGGQFLIGKTSTSGYKLDVTGDISFERTGTSDQVMVRLANANGTVGTIKTSGTSTSYNTSSDYRLKENVSDMTGATTRLKELKPKRFNFITDSSNTLLDGFLAHEVSSVVPEAVSGVKDAEIKEDGTGYQQIDHSKLVPLLVKTIQELEARITALEG